MIWALLLVTSILWARDPYVSAVTEGEPSANVFNCVNTITGDFFLSQKDIEVRGAEPIILRRAYISRDGAGEDHSGGWFFQPHLKIYYDKSGEEKSVQIIEPNGTSLFFVKMDTKKSRRSKGNVPFSLDHRVSGLTNCASGLMSGRTNPLNISVEMERDEKIFRVYGANGTERCYKLIPNEKKDKKKGIPYHLLWERMSNGNIIRYGYDEKNRLNAINSNNPTLTVEYAWVKLTYLTEDNFEVSTSDCRRLVYLHNSEGLLLHVESPEHPNESFSYLNSQKDCGPLIGSCQGFKQAQQFSVPYYRNEKTYHFNHHLIKINDRHDKRINRVKALRNHDTVLYTFLYYPEEGYTEVYDVDMNRTVYRYSKDLRLEKITRYKGENELLNSENFCWKGPNLLSREFYDEKNQPVMERRFTYDEVNNVKEESFISGGTRYSKRYTYDEEDLLLTEEEDNGKGFKITYLPNTDLVTSKLFLYQGRICKRTFCYYDENQLLIRTVEDDGASEDPTDLTGVSERRIQEIERRKENPFIGLPHFISEKALNLNTHKEELLSKIQYTYSLSGQVIRKDMYDKTNTPRYSLNYTYDFRGRLIEETNAIGQFARTTYNEWDDRASYEDFHNQSINHYTYDNYGRLVAIEEKGKDGQKRITTRKYDPQGRLIETVDYNGNATQYTYDPLGRLLSKKGACHPETLVYNATGQPILVTNGRGETTRTQYDGRGKPLEITHPDGSVHRYTYYSDGTLSDSIDPNGTRTHYTYDAFGNTAQKEVYSSETLLTLELFQYSAFHLLSHTDIDKHTTHYHYDSAGRKIAEIDEETLIQYSYDLLGRPNKRTQGDLTEVTEYDYLDRPVKTISDTLLEYTYDSFGNHASITRHIDGKPATEHFFYDSFNRPSAQIDALGHTTRIAYGRQKKTYTDPNGVQTIETYDALEQKIELEKMAPFGDLIYRETYAYDPIGNLIRQESDTITLWEYGPMHRVTQLTEAAGTPEQKITRTRYNASGQVDLLTKPDGTTLTHHYNALGQLIELSSSDGTIHYTYINDKSGRLLLSRDMITGKATQRTYDAAGRLIQEVLASGHVLSNTYDASGRRTELTLPDNSSISYTYAGALLKKVTRLTKNGEERYSHTYDQYDQEGNPLAETLIDKSRRTSHYDPLGRHIATDTPHFEQKATQFDPAGNLLELLTNSVPTTYTYDHLGQLLTEKNHTYTYDTRYNRTSKDGTPYTLNAANELISIYNYDANGNPITKSSITYIHDALGRLTEAQIEDSKRITYTYDSLHRCISRVATVLYNNRWTTLLHEDILYDDQNDIGTASPLGYIVNLRVLGRTPHAEIGSAVAFEIESKTYTPHYDLQGNVSALIGKNAAETYTYSAFGESTPAHIRTPWRYASKRYDPDLNLYNFGRRLYDPATGRFLTPDPKGYTDSLNLYAYVKNAPLTHYDLYGLETISRQMVQPAIISMAADVAYTALYHAMPESPFRFLALLFINLFTSKPRPLHAIACCPAETIGPTSSTQIVLNNGILTEHKEGSGYALTISNSTNTQTTFVHNNTQGFISDLFEALRGLLGFQTKTSHNMADALRERINASPNGEIIAIAHSQGGIDLKNALKLLTPQERAMIHVRTYGSPTTFADSGLRSLTHNISSRDSFALVFNPIAALKAVFAPESSNVRLLPSQNGFFDHGIGEVTYKKALNMDLKDLIR